MEWFEYLDANIIVSDAQNRVIYMNRHAIEAYAHEGGAGLIGKNLMDCHNERSRAIIDQILRTGEPNVYTIEKKGKRKLIYQSPWIVDGEIKGIVEISLVLPEEMPHFNRD